MGFHNLLPQPNQAGQDVFAGMTAIKLEPFAGTHHLAKVNQVSQAAATGAGNVEPQRFSGPTDATGQLQQMRHAMSLPCSITATALGSMNTCG